MKRTRIEGNSLTVPSVFEPLLTGAVLYDSSCSPEARVIYIDREDGYYLKSAPKGTLKQEAELTAYFHGKGLATEVLAYESLEKDWLLTARIRGEDCTHPTYLRDPKQLCDLLAERLRALHEMDGSDCPVQDRLIEYFAVAERNCQRKEYDLSYAADVAEIHSLEEAWQTVREGKSLLRADTLIHGDYCLPNVMLEDWHFRGFIDLGNGGIGDRHIDLFWGAWTLRYNLGTDAYRDRFFDAYGRDRVDPDCLRVVAAAEVFG